MSISNYFTIENGVLKEYNGGGAVVVPDGVTVIGKQAFGGCRTLHSVTLPDSVTRIEEAAFAQCWRLTDVRLPAGLTYIGPSAFASCGNLQITELPESVTEIGAWAFENCVCLQVKRIPDGVKKIGEGAFRRCKRMQGGDGFVIVRDVLYSYHGKSHRVVVPDHITALGAQSFERHVELTEVVLPEGLTRIGDSAFFMCENLAHIRLPDSVAEIGERAFAECAALREMYFPAALACIGASAFSRCVQLKEVRLPYGVVEIGAEAFAGCTALTGADLPDSILKIGNAAFAYCEELERLRVPAYAELPHDLATNPLHPFYGCGKLFDKAGFLILRGVLYRCDGSTANVTVPSCVTAIANNAFAHCSRIERVDLPSGLTRIGREAFRDCAALTVLTVPDTVRSIGVCAFAGCDRLEVRFSGALADADHAFDGAYAVIAPNAQFSLFSTAKEQDAAARGFLRALPAYDGNPTRPAYAACALRQWRKLMPMVLREDLVPAMAFYAENGKITADNFDNEYLTMATESGASGCAAFLLDWRAKNLPVPDIGAQFEQVWCDTAPEPEVREQDWMYEKLDDGTLRITAYCGTSTEVIVPARIGHRFVTEIGEHAFNAKGTKVRTGIFIRSVYLPDGITRIGAWAFYDCIDLAQIRLPDSLAEIGRRAFEGCIALTEIHLPDGLLEVDAHLFSKCERLRQLTIPASLRCISTRMFADCTALTDVTILSAKQPLAPNAFSGCRQLIIHAPAGSDAETFAIQHRIAFRVR